MNVATRKPSALYISVSISPTSSPVISGLDIAYGERGYPNTFNLASDPRSSETPIRILEQDATRKIPEYDDVERERILLSNTIGSSRAS
jgi:hypothetical protein